MQMDKTHQINLNESRIMEIRKQNSEISSQEINKEPQISTEIHKNRTITEYLFNV